METYKGKIVFEGYAIEEAKVVLPKKKNEKHAFTDPENEFNRFSQAREKVVKDLIRSYEETVSTIGTKEALIFQTHQLMAEDLDLSDLVKKHINEKMCAEDAIEIAVNEIATQFQQLDDEYMKARAVDAREVGEQFLNVLEGVNVNNLLDHPVVIVCKDMQSSTLMKFDRTKVKGLIMVEGNANSHVSILARALEIPTLVNIKRFNLDHSLNGQPIILDGISGKMFIEPDRETVRQYQNKTYEYIKELGMLRNYVGKETKTKDGHKIGLYANIASAFELDNVKKNDAEGIGLFRSEFLYLQTKDYPSEAFQFNYYREVIEEMSPNEVIIRTLDIGADKKVDYFMLPREENPALGYRSIRICRDRPEIFKTQLRALFRASIYGNLSIMIPMIISVEEVLFVKKMIEEVKKELTKEKIKFNDKVKVGIMIETPAAALISDELAKHVDFFSIGTNDLSQYTLACDRLNHNLINTFDPTHPAILKLIKLTVENAHKAHIKCGMCGELARNPEVIPFLCKIKIDELSCSAAYILKVRKWISEIDSRK